MESEIKYNKLIILLFVTLLFAQTSCIIITHDCISLKDENTQTKILYLDSNIKITSTVSADHSTRYPDSTYKNQKKTNFSFHIEFWNLTYDTMAVKIHNLTFNLIEKNNMRKFVPEIHAGRFDCKSKSYQVRMKPSDVILNEWLNFNICPGKYHRYLKTIHLKSTYFLYTYNTQIHVDFDDFLSLLILYIEVNGKSIQLEEKFDYEDSYFWQLEGLTGHHSDYRDFIDIFNSKSCRDCR